MTVVAGWDATSANLHLVPASAGPYGGGYLTGSGGIAWTAAQKAAYPQAVLFDQSPVNTPYDTTCDAFDCENGAVTIADLAPGLAAARANFAAGTRPGQRWPAVYQSAGNVTAVVNDLIAAGITSCPLIVAHYGLSQAQAFAMVAGASGPYPVVGCQYSDQGGGAYDLDAWDLTWLDSRSGPGGVAYLTLAQMEAIMAALPVLSPGMTDASLPYQYVHRLQAVLKDVYGYYGGAVDGVFGTSTAAAVKVLQARYGLAADGVCGPLTWMPVVTGAT